MVRRIRLFSMLGVLLLASASAHAGTLSSATWYQASDFPGLLQGIPMTRTSAQLNASGTSTATSIAVSVSYPAIATTIFQPGSVLDLAVQITQGGAQAITATPGMANGTPGIPGMVILMSAIHSGMGVNQSMFMIGANTIVQVPLSIGKANLNATFGTTTSGYFLVVGVIHWMTIDFYAWTPGTVQFTGLTSKGVALPNVTAMGSFNLTANGGGTVTLVSPSKISIDGNLIGRRTASFTTLVLTFVPEPGALLLLGAGGLTLLLGGRRAQR
jgi:hypothetical protein